MKIFNHYKLLFILLGIISIRFLFTDNAFRDQFYINEYLMHSEFLNEHPSIKKHLVFTINPYASTTDYIEKKDKISGLKNTLLYLFFIFITTFRVLFITALIYIIALLLGFYIFKYINKVSIVASVIGFLRSIPAIAWLPFLSATGLLLSNTGVFLFLFLGIFPIIMSQIIMGITSSPNEIINISRLSKLSNSRIYWTIIRLVSEMRFMQGLRYGLSIGLILMLVYEMFFESVPGLIRIVQPLSVNSNLWDSLLLLILIGLIGVSFDYLPTMILKYRNIVRLKKAENINELMSAINYNKA